MVSLACSKESGYGDEGGSLNSNHPGEAESFDLGFFRPARRKKTSLRRLTSSRPSSPLRAYVKHHHYVLHTTQLMGVFRSGFQGASIRAAV